jgi:parallel beta-helix repeat protein
LKRTLVGIFLFVTLVSVFVLAHYIQPAKGQTTTIYINSDGSMTPSTADIITSNNITYTLTGDITYPTYDGIVVERDSIIIDGNGHTLQGRGSGNGISLTGINNVSIKNINITNFQFGIYLGSSSNNTVSGNNLTANFGGIFLFDNSSYNNVVGNNVTANDADGIMLILAWNNVVSGNNVTANGVYGIGITFQSESNIINGNTVTANGDSGIIISGSSFNNVSGNTATANSESGILLYASSKDNFIIGNSATANEYGIFLYASSSNIVSENNATANSFYGIFLNESFYDTVSGNILTANGDSGIFLDKSLNNTLYNNNFINNTHQVYSVNSTNTWDNGYVFGGNYWSDYHGNDIYRGIYQNQTGSDGIGDTPYVIDQNNSDRYPLMQPFNLSLQDGMVSRALVAYRDLLSQLNSMYLQLQTLNSTLDDLRAEVSSLSLNSINLQISINNLVNQNNSLNAQLNLVFYVLGVFVALVVILLATTIYLATRKIKTEKTGP